MKCSSPEAVQLFHEGSLALAQVEANGMRVDLDYLDRTIRKSEKKLKEMDERLREDDTYKLWRKHFGSKTKLGSGEQLAHILFDVLKYPCRERTPTGQPRSSESNLVDIDLPFLHLFRKRAKLAKAKTTFMEGIRDFTTSDGLLHFNFNLNIAASYRSTSTEPNGQNFPTRVEEIAKLVRSAFIPRPGHRIIESDFSGIEVAGACCYTKDKNLIRDYTEGDMHRDMAMKCFKLPQEEVTKTIRYCGKNMFVFPEFYGSYYIDCARNLWENVARLKLITTSGVPLYDHLRAKGITELGPCDPQQRPRKGTFEAHVKEVEDEFWNVRYRRYNNWKKKVWQEYQRDGWCELYTGFVCTRDSDGLVMNRKQVINYRIQGTAFHMLLWCLTRLVKWLRKNKMRSMVVSQIHDSIIGDVHEDEREEYLAKLREIMTVDLLKRFPWINVPIGVEMEMSKLDGNWFQKEKVS